MPPTRGGSKFQFFHHCIQDHSAEGPTCESQNAPPRRRHRPARGKQRSPADEPGPCEARPSRRATARLAQLLADHASRRSALRAELLSMTVERPYRCKSNRRVGTPPPPPRGGGGAAPPHPFLPPPAAP